MDSDAASGRWIAAEAARAWDRTALVPLREVRRGLKAPLPPVDDRAREALREEVRQRAEAARETKLRIRSEIDNPPLARPQLGIDRADQISIPSPAAKAAKTYRDPAPCLGR